ncbi:MAG: hypothetical protein AABX33_07105 [Nanoarchaeota archaeon]
MDFKDYLKPSARKIVLTLFLAFLSLLYKRPNYCFDANCYPRGFPLPFADEISGGLKIAHQKYIGYFLIDFILFFLLVSLVYYIFNRFKK